MSSAEIFAIYLGRGRARRSNTHHAGLHGSRVQWARARCPVTGDPNPITGRVFHELWRAGRALAPAWRRACGLKLGSAGG